MTAALDTAGMLLTASLPALAVGTAVSALMGRWARRTGRRLDALEDRVPEWVTAPAPTRAVALLGSEEDAREVIARVREAYGQELVGDRFVTIVRQIIGVLPKPSSWPSPPQEREIGRRDGLAWAADRVDEVRGPNTSSSVDRLLSDLAAAFRRQAHARPRGDRGPGRETSGREADR